MRTVKMAWKCWYGDEDLELKFPEKWKVYFAPPFGGDSIEQEKVTKAFSEPIQSLPIANLAKGKKSVTIAVDDISRPTPVHKILPLVIQELMKGGITKSQIRIILALGAHRPMIREDCLKKLGRKIVSNFAIYNHHPYENLVDLGVSQRGTPVRINRYFAEADLKIGVGCIMPHPTTGFGGGGKIVLPGISGIDTLEANHKPAFMGTEKHSTIQPGRIEGNKTRADIDEIAKIAGLDIIVNVVLNSRREITGVYVGEPVSAHRAGIKLARQIYSTEVPTNVDVGIFNVYPKDTELIQAINIFDLYASSPKDIVRKNGVIVLITAASEGRGFHSLCDQGMRIQVPLQEHPLYGQIIKDKKLIIFSPNISYVDIRGLYPDTTIVLNKWHEVLEELKTYLRTDPSVAVFPCASSQLASTSN